MSKHARRVPRRLTKTAAAVGLAGGLTFAAAPFARAASMSDWESVAQCEAGGDWSINWSSDSLSVGGLQFQNPSWQDALSYLSSQGYDVSGFPQSLYQGMSTVPTKDEQVLAGEALLHMQGRGAWTTVSDGCASLGSSMFDGGPNPWGLSGTQWPGGGSTPPPSQASGSGSGDSGASSSGSTTSSEGEDGDTDNAPPPAPASAPSVPAPVAASTHTVVAGEWLIKLAEQYYGDWTKWQLIYNANASVIGPNPDLIFPGQVLTIPAG